MVEAKAYILPRGRYSLKLSMNYLNVNLHLLSTHCPLGEGGVGTQSM